MNEIGCFINDNTKNKSAYTIIIKNIYSEIKSAIVKKWRAYKIVFSTQKVNLINCKVDIETHGRWKYGVLS